MGRAKTLDIALPAAATPARVAAAAAMLAEALDAAYPGLPPDSVTMVVNNFEMRAQVRARSPEGAAAVATFAAFLENPTRAIHRKASATRIADAVAKYADHLAFATIKRPRARKQLATLDQRFTRELRALASVREPVQSVRGTTQIQGLVYRVGRTDEDSDIRARVRLDDEICDVRLSPQADPASFYDAAKSGVASAITVDAVWLSSGERLVIDPGRSRLSAVQPLDLSLGEAFLAEARTQAANSFDDVDDIIAGIEDR